MENQGYILLIFGLSMVVALCVIVAVYYMKREKRDVEAPKYKMLEDEE